MSRKEKSNVNILYKGMLAIALIILLIMINQIEHVGSSNVMYAFFFVSLVFVVLLGIVKPKSKKKRN